jgi:magnesium and cobalt transporter
MFDEEFDTIGGLIVHQMEHMPKRGETVEIDSFKFEILRADNRRVHLLKLQVPHKAGTVVDDAEGE